MLNLHLVYSLYIGVIVKNADLFKNYLFECQHFLAPFWWINCPNIRSLYCHWGVCVDHLFHDPDLREIDRTNVSYYLVQLRLFGLILLIAIAACSFKFKTVSFLAISFFPQFQFCIFLLPANCKTVKFGNFATCIIDKILNHRLVTRNLLGDRPTR